LASRVTPDERRIKGAVLRCFTRGLHSEWFYKRTEALADGVIDVTVREEGGDSKSFLRLRSLRGQPYDGRWHRIDVQLNGEATVSV